MCWWPSYRFQQNNSQYHPDRPLTINWFYQVRWDILLTMSYTITARVLLSAAVLVGLGCSKKQIVPGIITGGGAITLTSGVIYRASLEDADSLFGDTAQQKAVVATLVLTGTALILTGVILAATTPLCETDLDCWRGDQCDDATKSCVPKPIELDEQPQPALSLSSPFDDSYTLQLYPEPFSL